MKQIFYFLSLLLLGSTLHAQKQPDYRWLMGFRTDSTEQGFYNISLRFETDSVYVDSVNLNMNFESTVASATDSTGKLLFYTNGCEIRGTNGSLLPNGNGINPGTLHDWVCEKGYTLPKGAMALPYPGHPSQWILLHTSGRYDSFRKVVYENLNYTLIDMSLNGGLGAVLSKNNVLLSGETEPFSVVRHGNGRDWWVVVPVYGSNQYRLWLLSPTGFSAPIAQNIGAVADCRKIGSTVFSARGDKFARSSNCVTTVLDFDRCAGIFSNPIDLNAGKFVFGGGGVAFTKDSRWLYTTGQQTLYGADLTLASPTLDTAYAWVVNLGVSLGQLQNDWTSDKIYVGFMHRERFLSVIGKPLPNGSIDFRNEKLKLPVPVVRSIPNFPNFRLFDVSGSPCDTLGINTAIAEVAQPKGLRVYPNPATDELTVELPPNLQGSKLTLRLCNQLGQTVHSQTWREESPTQTISVASLPSGFYVVSVTNGAETWYQKVIVQR